MCKNLEVMLKTMMLINTEKFFLLQSTLQVIVVMQFYRKLNAIISKV